MEYNDQTPSFLSLILARMPLRQARGLRLRTAWLGSPCGKSHTWKRVGGGVEVLGRGLAALWVQARAGEPGRSGLWIGDAWLHL